MSENTENPFSPGKTMETYEKNRKRSQTLLSEIQEGIQADEKAGVLLRKAVEAIGKMTDNTIFYSVVEKALEERSGKE